MVHFILLFFCCCFFFSSFRFINFSFISAEHHVHFDQTTLKDEDFQTDSSCVIYQQIGCNEVDVQLGFLQHNHRYLIELHLSANLFKCQPNVPINLVADNNVTPNVHCKLADCVTEFYKTSNDDSPSSAQSSSARESKYFVIKVEYFAHKENILREELKLINTNNSVELLKLYVTARVLGKGKGTPLLRNGIHCLGYESDGDEATKSK